MHSPTGLWAWQLSVAWQHSWPLPCWICKDFVVNAQGRNQSPEEMHVCHLTAVVVSGDHHTMLALLLHRLTSFILAQVNTLYPTSFVSILVSSLCPTSLMPGPVCSPYPIFFMPIPVRTLYPTSLLSRQVKSLLPNYILPGQVGTLRLPPS